MNYNAHMESLFHSLNVERHMPRCRNGAGVQSFRLLRLILLTSLLSTSSPAVSNDSIEGVYKENGGTRPREDSNIENILEIVKYSDHGYYFRLHSELATTGCICDLWGIAQKRGKSFVWTGKEHDGCHLSLTPTRESILLKREMGPCCDHCSGPVIPDFRRTHRRPIRYLDKLRNSRQFKEAVSEFDAVTR
jgi:hypothetical protein